MSVTYVPVQWNRPKVVYDATLLAAVALYLWLFPLVARGVWPGTPQILAMRAWGTCGFLMITAILTLGPLARLDRRFLPLLYNRRHFGVIFFAVALGHAKAVLDYYHRYGVFGDGWAGRLASMLTNDTAFAGGVLPFPLFGLVALAIFLVMAVTSHDFWQAFLGPRAWKTLHMAVYAAYALVVLHVAWGALRFETHPGYAAFVALAAGGVAALHLVAARRSNAPDAAAARWVELDGVRWLDAGDPRAIPPDRARPLVVPGAERIALVRWGEGKVSAVHGVCAHQGGPLYEGKVIDGALTCPWHHWTYRPGDGQSPPPFTEKLPTYRVRLHLGRLLVDPRPLPPGTPVTPVELAPDPAPDAPAPPSPSRPLPIAGEGARG